VIKEKASSCVYCIVEVRHGFYPFGKVVVNEYDILVPIVGWGVASHEVDAPFTEGDDGDDGMEEKRWCSGFVCVQSTLAIVLDCVVVVMK